MMTPTIATESIILGCLLAVLVLSEVSGALRRRRINAATYLQHCEEIVDKEMQR